MSLQPRYTAQPFGLVGAVPSGHPVQFSPSKTAQSFVLVSAVSAGVAAQLAPFFVGAPGRDGAPGPGGPIGPPGPESAETFEWFSKNLKSKAGALTYDASGRLSSIAYPEVTKTFGYSPAGRLESVTLSGASIPAGVSLVKRFIYTNGAISGFTYGA